MNFLSTKFCLIIRSNECVVVHLLFFLFTSKPGNVTNSTSFDKVLPKFAQNFEDSEQTFYVTDLYFFDLYFHMKNRDFHFTYTLNSGFNYQTLVVTICSVLCYIQSYLQLHQTISFMS